MSLRTSLLRRAEWARRKSGPTFADIRVNQLTIRTRTWSGSTLDSGTATDEDLVLPAHYPVRHLTGEEINSAAGRYEVTDLLVDHITPFDGIDVGYTPAQLKPTVTANNVELIYIITGPEGGEYSCVDLRAFRPFTYQLVLRRKTTTP